MIWTLYDLFRRKGGKEAEIYQREPEVFPAHGIQRLILLDQEGKPIKSWDLQGKVSQIIGKAGRDQELDIDLSDCEYSSFIDFQHAALNFSLDQWYVEDLGSQNGVRVRKAEDGECYKVMGRPCRIQAGDVLYIANPRLINVLHKDTVYLKDGEIDQICLCRELVEIHRVFGVKGKHRTDIVIAGDVLEEMLKEEIVGFQAVPVSVKEGTPWQKNM